MPRLAAVSASHAATSVKPVLPLSVTAVELATAFAVPPPSVAVGVQLAIYSRNFFDPPRLQNLWRASYDSKERPSSVPACKILFVAPCIVVLYHLSDFFF